MGGVELIYYVYSIHCIYSRRQESVAIEAKFFLVVAISIFSPDFCGIISFKGVTFWLFQQPTWYLLASDTCVFQIFFNSSSNFNQLNLYRSSSRFTIHINAICKKRTELKKILTMLVVTEVLYSRASNKCIIHKMKNFWVYWVVNFSFSFNTKNWSSTISLIVSSENNITTKNILNLNKSSISNTKISLGTMSRLQGKLRFKIALRTDRRVKLMNEIVTGIQVIKMYAWEKPFEKMVALLRK